jgi:dTDP-4-dehydrorhamnose 3,5-epimerase-like enzyme
MTKEINVKNSGIIELQFHNDFPDGNLIIAEAQKNIPFEIKRVYYINNLFNKTAVRGHHAHKELNQIIFCINGSFTLGLDDGEAKQEIVMDEYHLGVKLGTMLWHTMYNFSADCVILVFADDYYKESDYIRNYDDFKNIIK